MRQEEGDATARVPMWGKIYPPENARCARCKSADISCLPSFSIGSGVAVRSIAEDVYCRRCGYIGIPNL
ncbi:MAG TPA: hypothetical protein VFA07_06325 [Chthonomonadaceae bacterium]|nr:hypothetical protein [Chthonomonadaceae bacterium]